MKLDQIVEFDALKKIGSSPQQRIILKAIFRMGYAVPVSSISPCYNVFDSIFSHHKLSYIMSIVLEHV